MGQKQTLPLDDPFIAALRSALSGWVEKMVVVDAAMQSQPLVLWLFSASVTPAAANAAHALSDAHRAIRLLRARAAEFSLRPDRIGILGFSAGGELALLAAARHSPGDPASARPLDRG